MFSLFSPPLSLSPSLSLSLSFSLLRSLAAFGLASMHWAIGPYGLGCWLAGWLVVPVQLFGFSVVRSSGGSVVGLLAVRDYALHPWSKHKAGGCLAERTQ